MKLKSLFLSAVLTSFILVVLAGVIKTKATDSASTASSSPSTVAQAPQPTDPPPPANTVAPTTSSDISPQEAIAIASARLGSSDLYSIETAKLGGMDVYKVTFSSGNIVYVSPQGHILVVTSLAQILQQQNPAGQSSVQPFSSGGHSSDSHDGDSGDD